jgi:ribonuclease G
MARSTLVINCDICETRVCLIEDGVIAELQIERASSRSSVGNIVLGKVTRVLPGMQAAFIDVGMDRAAFLHVEDLIRPDDFEAYLSGGAREDHEVVVRGQARGSRRGQWEDTAQEAESEARDDEEADLRDDRGEDDDDEDADNEDVDDEDDAGGEDDDDEEADQQDADAEADARDESTEGHGDLEAKPARDLRTAQVESTAHDGVASGPSEAGGLATDSQAAAGASGNVANEQEARKQERGQDSAAPSDDSMRATTRTTARRARVPDGQREGAGNDGALQSEVEAEPAEVDVDRAARRRRRRRRRKNHESAADKPSAQTSSPAFSQRQRAERLTRRELRRQRPRNGRRNGNNQRVCRAIPITDVVKEGDEVVVQISKEPIGTKGARVTSHVSLPGRYAVYLPTVEHVGISKRIGSARERARLREVIESLKPDKGGLIVRTVAEGLTKKALKADVGYLIKLWDEVSRKRETSQAPSVLYTELDLVLKTARDLFTDEIEKIVIDDKEQYARLVRFVEMFLPERVQDIELYQGTEPIFDAYGIEDEIGRALSRKVPLPSGGYLVIDQAEALAAIDVNTGRYVGKGSKDLEETALKTNLEAVDEIAYQLRFRNIGGLVILDLIDMEHPSSREKVWRALEQRLAKDKAKTTLNRISDLGLIEMTRKRTRESLSRTMHEPCFYCDGTGHIMSRHTIAYEILRQIRRERESLPGYSVVVNAHPAIVDLMKTEEKEAVAEAERRYMRRIELNPRREYHIEQFDLQGR